MPSATKGLLSQSVRAGAGPYRVSQQGSKAGGWVADVAALPCALQVHDLSGRSGRWPQANLPVPRATTRAASGYSGSDPGLSTGHDTCLKSIWIGGDL